MTESDASLFVKLVTLVRHLSIDNGYKRRFIVPLDLSQNGGRNRMTSVLLIIQMLVPSSSYHKLVKTPFLMQVVTKEKVVLL